MASEPEFFKSQKPFSDGSDTIARLTAELEAANAEIKRKRMYEVQAKTERNAVTAELEAAKAEIERLGNVWLIEADAHDGLGAEHDRLKRRVEEVINDTARAMDQAAAEIMCPGWVFNRLTAINNTLRSAILRGKE